MLMTVFGFVVQMFLGVKHGLTHLLWWEVCHHCSQWVCFAVGCGRVRMAGSRRSSNKVGKFAANKDNFNWSQTCNAFGCEQSSVGNRWERPRSTRNQIANRSQ